MSLELVELEGVAWEYLPFTLYFRGSLTESGQAELRELVDNWYADGSRCAFGGPMHSFDEVGFDTDASGAHTAEWVVDMGDADESALRDLLERLEQFAERRHASLDRLVLGTIVVE